MRPVRGGAGGEEQRAEAGATFGVAVTGQDPEPATTACSGCHVALAGPVTMWVDGVSPVPAAHRGPVVGVWGRGGLTPSG